MLFNFKSYVESHLLLLLIYYNSYKSYLYFEKNLYIQIKQNWNLRKWKMKCKFYQQETVFCPHGETQLKSYEIIQNMIYILTDKSWFLWTTHGHYQKWNKITAMIKTLSTCDVLFTPTEEWKMPLVATPSLEHIYTL